MSLFESKKHSIGKVIAELRKEKGWTQAELAEKLQVSDKAISKWEKDNGAPSVEFFPTLAEIFDVSIDYIMTGKTIEPETIAISRAQLCAKKDDITMLSAIDVRSKDEDGKTLIDYVNQFQSLKVFIAVAEKHGLHVFGLVNGLKLAIASNRLDLIDQRFWEINKLYSNRNHDKYKDKNGILFLLPKALSKFFRGSAYDFNSASAECVLDDDFFSFIICDNRIKKETLDFLLGKQERRKCVWYHSFPYLIHQAYVNKKSEMLEKLIYLAQENNDYAYTNINFGQTKATNTFRMFCFCLPSPTFGLVHILHETITLALEQGDIKNAKRFNELNSSIKDHYSSIMLWNDSSNSLPIVDEHGLKLCELKSKNASAEKLLEADCIYNGIIDVKQVLATNNYNFIEKMFNTYPFSHFEVIEKFYLAKQYKELYRLCIDLGLEQLARDIINCSKYDTLNEMDNIIEKIVSCDKLDNRNKEFLPYRSIQWNVVKMTKPFGQWCKSTDEKKAEILADIRKKNIIDADKESFEALLNNNTEELVIVIKLCVKLEEILSRKYQLTGDLLEMLTEWERTHNAQDSALLHALRRRRNTLAHNVNPDDSQAALSTDELKKCIEIICKMAQED